MLEQMDIWLPIVVLLALIAVRMPIGVALGLSGLLGLFFVGGTRAAFGQLDTLTYHVPATYTFAVIPFFIFMGALASEGGFAAAAYASANRWLGRLPGGLAMATTVGSGALSAASGSTVVNAAVFGRIAYPEMMAYGYDKRLTAGTIAASGTFAAMIPPSVTVVLFGIITGTSIGELLIAGFLPGLLTVVIYLMGIYVLARLRPQFAPRADHHYTLAEKFSSLRGVWGIALIFVAVMGGIYLGYFTPTQAGAVGAFAALAVLLVSRRLSRDNLGRALVSTVVTTSSLFIIIIGGFVFARFLTLSGVVSRTVDAVSRAGVSPWMVLLAVLAIYIFLGMFLDPASMLVISLPLTYPLLVGLGFEGVWIGILVIKIVEIAMITPPVGMNAYVLKSVLSDRDVSIGEIFSGLSFFLLLDVITLTALILFPQIATWLPAQMS